MSKKKYQGLSYISQETGLPVSYLKQLTQSGKLPALKVGQRYLYDPTQVQATLEKIAAEKGGGDEPIKH